MVIAAAGGLIAAGILAAVHFSNSLWYILTFILCVVDFKVFWGKEEYRCRKCGSKTSRQYDLLHYSSDLKQIDVAEKRVKKIHFGYWPDMTRLDDNLQPPEQPGSGEK